MTQGARAFPWLTEWEYAHRGLHSAGVPENSLAAAQGALAAGMGIECDIQRSRDGAPMVFHDWELERLTHAGGLVEERDAASLETLCLLGTEQRIWRLEGLLERISGRVPLLIEIKSKPDYDIAPTCAAVAAALQDYAGPHAVMSFDPQVLTWFARHAPKVARGLVGTDHYDNGFLGMWRGPDIQVMAQELADFLAIDIRDCHREEAQQWRTARPLLTWTVRSADLRKRGLELADVLIAEGEGLA